MSWEKACRAIKQRTVSNVVIIGHISLRISEVKSLQTPWRGAYFDQMLCMPTKGSVVHESRRAKNNLAAPKALQLPSKMGNNTFSRESLDNRI
jgi:hypothetical protein